MPFLVKCFVPLVDFAYYSFYFFIFSLNLRFWKCKMVRQERDSRINMETKFAVSPLLQQFVVCFVNLCLLGVAYTSGAINLLIYLSRGMERSSKWIRNSVTRSRVEVAEAAWAEGYKDKHDRIQINSSLNVSVSK